MDSGFRRNDEFGRRSSARKEKRQELDPDLRRDDEKVGTEQKKKNRTRS
jgi:hypothetical protein